MPPKPPGKRRLKKKKKKRTSLLKKKKKKKLLRKKRRHSTVARTRKVEVSITADDLGKKVWCKGGAVAFIRFVGETEFSTGLWVGVEFAVPIGE